MRGVIVYHIQSQERIPQGKNTMKCLSTNHTYHLGGSLVSKKLTVFGQVELQSGSGDAADGVLI